MKPIFDHEKLDVYQEALIFCGWVGDLLDRLEVRASVRDQLDRASTSIPLNIAERNAKFSTKDRARFLEIAAGSALECAACFDVMIARKLITAGEIAAEKERLARIMQMIIGLLRRFSPHADGVLREEPSTDYDYE